MRQAVAALWSQKRHRRINLTDPEARPMKGRQSIVAGYNAQAMVSPMETCRGSIRHDGHRRGRGGCGQ